MHIVTPSYSKDPCGMCRAFHDFRAMSEAEPVIRNELRRPCQQVPGLCGESQSTKPRWYCNRLIMAWWAWDHHCHRFHTAGAALMKNLPKEGDVWLRMTSYQCIRECIKMKCLRRNCRCRKIENTQKCWVSPASLCTYPNEESAMTMQSLRSRLFIEGRTKPI